MQLDIYGEVVGAMHIARARRLAEPHEGWPNQVLFVEQGFLLVAVGPTAETAQDFLNHPLTSSHPYAVLGR